MIARNKWIAFAFFVRVSFDSMSYNRRKYYLEFIYLTDFEYICKDNINLFYFEHNF